MSNYLDKDSRAHPAVLKMPLSQLRRLIEQWGLACCWCSRFCNPGLSPNADAYPTREHLIRKADGGSNRMSNLRIACRKCNGSRHVAGWQPLKAAPNVSNKVYAKTLERLSVKVEIHHAGQPPNHWEVVLVWPDADKRMPTLARHDGRDWRDLQGELIPRPEYWAHPPESHLSWMINVVSECTP